MSMVLDASMALACFHPDERTSSLDSIVESLRDDGAWVPALWRLEVANALQMGVRRKRHSASFRDAVLADLALLPITIDTETNHHAWKATTRLADTYGLTVYDAAYLELAIRQTLPLATMDRDLRVAATSEGVTLLPASDSAPV